VDIHLAAPAADGLLQYGAIGIIAVLLLYAIRIMFNRQVQDYERDRRELTDRCQKAEEQLAAVNLLLREQLVAQLTRATDVMGRVAELLSHGQQRN